MDYVFIRELRLPAWIGLYRHEKVAPQTVELDLEFGLPGDSVFQTGKVRDTIDYGVVCERIRSILEVERFGLVETLADRIAGISLASSASATGGAPNRLTPPPAPRETWGGTSSGPCTWPAAAPAAPSASGSAPWTSP